MPAPISDEKRTRITELCGQGVSRNDIAREVSVSPSTVSKIAEEIGHSFDRTAVENATRARKADNAAKRAQLVSDLLDDAQEFRAMIRQPHTVHDFTKDGEFVTGVLERPTAGDIRNYMTSLGIAVDKTIAIERADLGGGDVEARGLLVQIVESIRSE
jgi:transposase-like protein